MASLGGNDDTPVTPEALMSMMKDMMQMIAQHREKMSKHSDGQQNHATTPPSQPEASSKASEETAIKKLTKFKNFATKNFKEVATPNKVEEWLEELEVILEAL